MFSSRFLINVYYFTFYISLSLNYLVYFTRLCMFSVLLLFFSTVLLILRVF
jgi:hypothetical protein